MNIHRNTSVAALPALVPPPYILHPEPDYDAMSDKEFDAIGGTNALRTEMAVRTIAAEWRANPMQSGLAERLVQAATLAAWFAEIDPEGQAEDLLFSVAGIGDVEAPLVVCIDLLLGAVRHSQAKTHRRL